MAKARNNNGAKRNEVEPLGETLYARIIRLIELGKSTDQIVADLNKRRDVGATPERLRATLPLLSQKNKNQARKHLKINDQRAKLEEEEEKAKAEAEAKAQAEAEIKAEAEAKAQTEAEAKAKAKKEAAQTESDAANEGAKQAVLTPAEEERILSSERERLESEYSTRFSKKQQLHQELEGLRGELIGMRQKISAAEARARATVEEINKLQQEMSECADKWQPVVRRLEALQEILKKVTIFVFRDEIKAYRGEQELPLDLTGWETKRQELFDDESGDYVDLTIWQAGIVAKMIIIKELESLKPFEIEFILDNGLQDLDAYLE